MIDVVDIEINVRAVGPVGNAVAIHQHVRKVLEELGYQMDYNTTGPLKVTIEQP